MLLHPCWRKGALEDREVEAVEGLEARRNDREKQIDALFKFIGVIVEEIHRRTRVHEQPIRPHDQAVDEVRSLS